MSCFTISSARALPLRVVVGDSEGNDVDNGVAGVVVDEFGIGI